MKKVNVTFDQKFIESQPIKWVTEKQFLKMSESFLDWAAIIGLKELLTDKPHGFYLGMLQNEKGRYKCLRLKRIYMRTFNMKYSVHKNTKEGKELLISNMPLPPIKL